MSSEPKVDTTPAALKLEIDKRGLLSKWWEGAVVGVDLSSLSDEYILVLYVRALAAPPPPAPMTVNDGAWLLRDILTASPAPDHEALVGRLTAEIVQAVAELPDRTSPDDWPEAMLVTSDELRQIVLAALAAAPVPLQEYVERLKELERTCKEMCLQEDIRSQAVAWAERAELCCHLIAAAAPVPPATEGEPWLDVDLKDDDGDVVIGIRGVPGWHLVGHGTTVKAALRCVAQGIVAATDDEAEAGHAALSAPVPALRFFCPHCGESGHDVAASEVAQVVCAAASERLAGEALLPAVLPEPAVPALSEQDIEKRALAWARAMKTGHWDVPGLAMNLMAFARSVVQSLTSEGTTSGSATTETR